MIPIMWLVGHQWLADGGEGKHSQTMYCIHFLQIILREKLIGMTTAVNLTSAAPKMKNLQCVLTSLREHQGYRYKLKAHQDGLPLLLEPDLDLNFRVHARISHWYSCVLCTFCLYIK